MADASRPIPIGAAIYASAHRTVQPPDDRTYAAEVTGKGRNLLHHRIHAQTSPTRALLWYNKPLRLSREIFILFKLNCYGAARTTHLSAETNRKRNLLPLAKRKRKCYCPADQAGPMPNSRSTKQTICYVTKAIEFFPFASGAWPECTRIPGSCGTGSVRSPARW